MAKVKINTKWLCNLTPGERAQLNRLTLKIDSMMREDVLWRKERLDVIRVFIAKDDAGKILGWSSVILPCKEVFFPVAPRSKYLPIYTYVMQKHRRKGVGGRLIRAASKFITDRQFKPHVIAWDTRSLGFFSKCKEDRGIAIRIAKDFYKVESLIGQA